MLDIGQVVERFHVDAVIGQGSQGTVYLVKHSRLGTMHALKVLGGGSRHMRRRMLNEARLQAPVRHPNVVQVNDLLEVDGGVALVMEYVDGPNLQQWLWSAKPSIAAAELVFRGIVAGVTQLHRMGMVHRDLKPPNVLLAQGPSGGIVPKVTDFGLAKYAGDGSGQTASGQAMGTPAYMAPEQIRDAKTVDTRADIFALGCILYEMVCGQPAFQAGNVLDIMNAITGGEYIPPQRVNPHVPDRIARVIEACLVVDPDQRIPDTETLLDMLSGGGVEHPSFPIGPFDDLPYGNRIMGALIFVAVLGTLALGLVVGWSMAGQGAASPSAELAAPSDGQAQAPH